VWLAFRREWPRVALFGLAYAAITLFWFQVYPAWLIAQADPLAIVERPDRSLLAYLAGKLGRLLDYSPLILIANLARFAAWQNVLLIPLSLAALPLMRDKRAWKDSLLIPLVGVCALGLILIVYQGHGWGYRYLSGAIGAFCLVGAYGWIRLVPEQGAGRAWSMVKCSCVLALLVALPMQLVMARIFVSPYADLYRAARAAPADVVLVDISGGFFAQDIVQNNPDFRTGPRIMDLLYVSANDLELLCRENTVEIIDRRHYRAVGMLEQPMPEFAEERLAAARSVLAREGCASPVKLERS